MSESVTIIRLRQHLKTAQGSLLPAGTEAALLGVKRAAEPVIYECRTLPGYGYKVELFYCCEIHFEVVKEVADAKCA